MEGWHWFDLNKRVRDVFSNTWFLLVLLVGVLYERDVRQGDLAHVVDQVEPSGLRPRRDDQVVREQEALADGLPLLLATAANTTKSKTTMI